MKIKIRDERNFLTFKDQRNIEIYDLYDMKNEEPIPKILQDASYEEQGNHTRKVTINYPTIGMFNLNGGSGYTTYYAERGKKAFVRGGKYTHPEKGYSVRIEMMSPMNYIKRCYSIFNSNRPGSVDTIEHLISGREEDYDLDEIFGPLKGDIFYPVIDYNDKGQEGLHRTIYALQQNIPLIPVIVIY